MSAAVGQLSQSQTLVRGVTRVPAGHIIVSDKWRATDLANALQGKFCSQIQPTLRTISNPQRNREMSGSMAM